MSSNEKQEEPAPLIQLEEKRGGVRDSILAPVETCLDNDLMNGNGHSMYTPKHYTDVIPVEFHSDVEGLSGIQDNIICNDGIIRSINGIGSLDFHYWLIGQIRKIDPTFQYDDSKIGRGSQAREMMHGASKWLSNEKKL